MSVPMWLVQLLSRKSIGNLRLGPEDRVCVEWADRLRRYSLDGKLAGCWSHLPHEVGGAGRLAMLRISVAKALGLIPGSGDYVFTRAGGCLWVEAKSKVGSLTETQKLFRQWAEREGVPYEVIRSADEGDAALRRHGFLA